MIFACTAPAGWSVSRDYEAPAPGTNVMVKFTPDEGGWSRAVVKRAVTGTSGSFLVLYEDEPAYHEAELTRARYSSSEAACYPSWVSLAKVGGRRARA